MRVDTDSNYFEIIHQQDFTQKVSDTMDIHDEGLIFQYSLINIKFPDFLFETARKLQELISISKNVNSVLLRSNNNTQDFGYIDLETQFKLKQNGFNNF